MEKLKTVDIKGKPYVEVAERIRHFRDNYKGYRLVSEMVEHDDKSCVFVAKVIDPEGNVIATGYAMEEKSSSFINKTSHIENCETSAWGRALGNFGIGVDSSMSIASANEVANSQNNQKKQPQQKQKPVAIDNVLVADLIYERLAPKTPGLSIEKLAEFVGKSKKSYDSVEAKVEAILSHIEKTGISSTLTKEPNNA